MADVAGCGGCGGAAAAAARRLRGGGCGARGCGGCGCGDAGGLVDLAWWRIGRSVVGGRLRGGTCKWLQVILG